MSSHTSLEDAAKAASVESSPPAKFGACLNCGAERIGPYCHCCGQDGAAHAETLSAVMHEWLEGLIHFDGRIVRTLWCLIARPGALTEAWLTGRRVAFVPPVRLYIFISLIFFLVISMTHTALVAFVETPTVSNPGPSGRAADVVFLTPADKIAPMNIDAEDLQDVQLPPESRVAGRFLSGLLASFEHPAELSGAMETWSPRIMFVMLPVFALILALAAPRGRKGLLDQMVFSLHFHAALFGVLTIAVLLSAASSALGGPVFAGTVAEATLLLTPIYLILALRRAYSVSWLGALFCGTVAAGAYYVCAATALTAAIGLSLYSM